MLRESVILVRAKMIMDLAFLNAIIIGVQSHFNLPDTVNAFSPFLLVLLTSTVAWLFCARAFGLYGDLRFRQFSIEWVMFLKAFGLYVLVTSFIAFQVFANYPYGKHQFLLQAALGFFLLPAQKVLIRVLFKRLWNSNNMLRKVLIVGAGKTGLEFYDNYVRDHQYGYQLTGFIDDESKAFLNGHYLGKTADINRVIEQHELDDIVVTLPITQETKIKRIVAIAEREGKRVRLIHNYETFGNERMHVDRMGSLSMVTLRSLPLDSIDLRICKRTFDIFFSFFFLVFVASWLFPILALIIKCTSRGPVFFKQERWGLNNKSIVCLKFRTMMAASQDVDAEGRYQQARKNDPRVTPIGGFLRKTSLDELPQFINVLLGSMSVIGPRPHPVPLNIESKDCVEKYMMRHWVKPGISGWAQVNGYRGETKANDSMRKRIQYDLWYIENWTFWLDLQIILQTIVNAVKGEKNAY